MGWIETNIFPKMLDFFAKSTAYAKTPVLEPSLSVKQNKL